MQTRDWLIAKGFPPGPIHLTRTHVPTMPIYSSVGKFKLKYLRRLQGHDLEIAYAFGNTKSDRQCYINAQIPRERIFLIGPHRGDGGTMPVHKYRDLLPYVLHHVEPSPIPLPYSSLRW